MLSTSRLWCQPHLSTVCCEGTAGSGVNSRRGHQNAHVTLNPLQHAHDSARTQQHLLLLHCAHTHSLCQEYWNPGTYCTLFRWRVLEPWHLLYSLQTESTGTLAPTVLSSDGEYWNTGTHCTLFGWRVLEHWHPLYSLQMESTGTLTPTILSTDGEYWNPGTHCTFFRWRVASPISPVL